MVDGRRPSTLAFSLAASKPRACSRLRNGRLTLSPAAKAIFFLVYLETIAGDDLTSFGGPAFIAHL
jgi:hypothetical protein